MDQHAHWLRVAADILHAPEPEVARGLLADELLRQTRADHVTRVGLRPEAPEAISISVTSRAQVPPREHWPVAAQARSHPLGRYYATTRDSSPVRLVDLLAAGWELSEDARDAMAALGITCHQMSVPCSTRGDFDGWVVLNEHGFSNDDLRALTELSGLVVGLDRHIGVLARCGDPDRAERSVDPSPALTPREQVVLDLIAEGSTAQAIGARLCISPRTVHKHQENLYRKLGASDRLGAVLRAQQIGLLRPGTQPPSGSCHSGAHSDMPATTAMVSSPKSSSLR